MPPRAKVAQPETRPQDRALDMTRVSSALGFQLRILDQIVSKRFTERFSELNITQTLFAILTLVDDNPMCRQTELSAALRMHPPNLFERVNLLIERGLVARRADPTDRRANGLELTVAGRRFRKELEKTHAALTEDLRVELGADLYDALMRFIPEATGLPALARGAARDLDFVL